MNVSKDQQELIVSALIKNSYLYSICKEELTDGYFLDPSCKIIYKSLSMYYQKYGATPGLNELLIMIDASYYPTCGVNLAEVKDTCQRLFDIPDPDETFIKDKITDFLRKVRSSAALKAFIDEVKVNPNLESDDIVSNLAKALEVQLSTTKIFLMNNDSQVEEARKSSVGSDQSSIIKSILPSLNNSLMFGGYQPNTVNMIVAPPGCFTGDTKVMTLDGEIHTLEELCNSNKLEVYGCDEHGHIKISESSGVVLSKYTSDLVEVELDNIYRIRCTPDHQFMMRDGTYKRADELQDYDSLMPIKREYREAEHGGGGVVQKSMGYECVIDGNNNWDYTHKISARRISHSQSESQIHHINCNRLDNRLSNLTWMTTHDHMSYHYWKTYHDNKKFKEGSDSGRIKPGEHRSPATEFTSEQISDRNRSMWKDPSYRDYMRSIISESSKNSKLVKEYNYSEEYQRKFRKGKVLNFVNSLLVEFHKTYISESEYDEYAQKSSRPRKVWKSGIEEAYGAPVNLIWDTLMEEASVYNHKVTNITKLQLEHPVPVYDVVGSETENFAIALSESEGVFVHNCGKSMFLINEGANAAKQGFDVLHIFIGDLVEYDGFIRYLSCISKTPQNSLVMMPVQKQTDVRNLCNQQYDDIFSRIFILAYPSLSLSVDTLMEDVVRFEKQLTKNFGMIIVDYPDNLIQDGRSLYEDGGTLYSSLERLSRLTKSVILVASQPSRGYWQHQIIPLEGASESAKKQMCVDIMLTMNTDSRGANFGSFLLAKARKGEVGKILRFKTDYSKCQIEEIDEGTFSAMKSAYGIKQN